MVHGPSEARLPLVILLAGSAWLRRHGPKRSLPRTRAALSPALHRGAEPCRGLSLARATLLGWGPPRVGGLEFKGLREK